MQTLATSSRRWFTRNPRIASYSQLHWLDINVALRNILYRQATEGSRIINYRQPLSLDYCILEGVGTVEKALTVVEDRLEFDQFAVHIAGYDEDEPDEPEFEEGSCRIVWNSNGDHSHRSIVYIAYGLLRHLVELFVTKRIDEVQLSVQIAVASERPANPEGWPDSLPLLGETGHLHFQRARCELLSVYTNLGKR